MTFVVELRDLKKSLRRPVPHFWQRAANELCALRIRLATLGLLGVAFVDRDVTSSNGGLALLCGVLTAGASATLGLLRDTSIGLATLFSSRDSPAFRLGQSLSVCFDAPLSPFEICPEAGPFPVLSDNSLFALAACALLLFGCNFKRQESLKSGNGR